MLPPFAQPGKWRKADDSDEIYVAELCSAAREAKSTQPRDNGPTAPSVASRTATQGIPSESNLPAPDTVQPNRSSRVNTAENFQSIDKMNCLVPHIEIFNQYRNKLEVEIGKLNFNEILHIFSQGLHQGIGLNRVVYAVISPDRKKLEAKLIVGGDNDPAFKQFQIQISTPNLLTRLLEKPQYLCVNEANRQKFWQSIPSEFKIMTKVNSFVAMLVYAQSKPVGLLYADRETSACDIEQQSYLLFKHLGRVAVKCLEKASNP